MCSLTRNKILQITAERLGIHDQSAINKADEFLRVLNTKGAVKAISDIAKTILCLDLSATYLGTAFDKETALKLAGLRKTAYQNHLNNIEKILGVDRPLTISELCVQLSCTVVKETAEIILNKYKENDGKIKDLSHPQYVAAAVCTACNVKSVKVDQSALVSASRLKRNQWKELVDEFAKFAQLLGLSAAKKRGRPKKGDEEVEENASNTEATSARIVKNKEEEENLIEEYEVWKERIIKEATAEILRNKIST